MKKLILFLFIPVLFIFFLYYNHQFNYNLSEHNDKQIAKGKIVSSDNKREIYLNNRQITVREKNSNKLKYLQLPDPESKNDKIIVDKSKNILYFYQNGELSNIFSVATGKKPEYTPEGVFKIANKILLTDGYSPDSLFGPRWMGLSVSYTKDIRANGKKDLRAPQGHKYGIHGTNEPNSIGTHASGGCIRLKNSDVIKLFDMVKVGTPVQIIK